MSRVRNDAHEKKNMALLTEGRHFFALISINMALLTEGGASSRSFL